MRKFVMSATLAVASLALSSVSSAALLNNGAGLVPDRPDVFSSFVSVRYSASSGQLVITGSPFSIANKDSTTTNIGGPRSFTINAVIAGGGSNPTVSSASISVTGNVDSVPGAEILIASSQPFAFGFGSSKIEFIFLNNAGILLPGEGIGVIVSYPGAGGIPAGFNFGTDLVTGNAGVADAWVPEPAALGLLAPVGALLLRRRKA